MKNLFLIINCFLLFSFSSLAQNTGIGTADPQEKLEIKNSSRSAVKISSNDFEDTTQLILSNRVPSGEGTDFVLAAEGERNLRVSSRSDLAGNRHDSILLITPGGNIGVNKNDPAHRLDVRGNVNVTGTILANGSDGSTGQFLMKNSSGGMTWGNGSCAYPHTAGFQSRYGTTPDNYTWTVPAGVTSLFVEVWAGGGGGGGGQGYSGGNTPGGCGGGGGGYLATEWPVTPGAVVAVSVGNYGEAGTSTALGTNGGNSTVTISGVSVITSGGSRGAVSQGGRGGYFSTTSPSLLIYGESGAGGQSTTETYGAYSATSYFVSTKGGDGGAAGNTNYVSNNGGFLSAIMGTGVLRKSVTALKGVEPGGGGGGDPTLVTGGPGGGYGAPGRVIIHY